MLTEERYAAILQTLGEHKTATVSQLADDLHVSESTIRRDLIALNRMGKLCKVHGGATVNNNNSYLTLEEDVLTKQDLHNQEKAVIAKYAASLIKPEDFIYLDAGTTTYKMLEQLSQTAGKVVYVTNGIQHAARLAGMGCKVYLPGGRLKANTQALIGTEAIRSISNYNFTKGFFGTNGISTTAGFSTPDFSEGNVKAEAMRHCQKCYILADSSKFKKVFPVTFAKLPEAHIITDVLPDDKYRKLTAVYETGEVK